MPAELRSMWNDALHSADSVRFCGSCDCSYWGVARIEIADEDEKSIACPECGAHLGIIKKTKKEGIVVKECFDCTMVWGEPEESFEAKTLRLAQHQVVGFEKFVVV